MRWKVSTQIFTTFYHLQLKEVPKIFKPEVKTLEQLKIKTKVFEPLILFAQVYLKK